MEIKSKHAKAFSSNFCTGAKKVAATTTIFFMLFSVAPTIAHADVPATNIIGDAEVSEDRSQIKIQDGEDIRAYFEGYDEYGVPNIDQDEIRKSIELSNALNAYYLSPIDFTNTTKDEVLSLDIDSLYDNYLQTKDTDSYSTFCNNALFSKPAIDAYTLFACGTVSRNIKNTIASNIFNIISSEYGIDAVTYPQIIIRDNEISAIFTVNGSLQKIILSGDIIDQVKASCTSLDTRYWTGLNNITGNSSYYEDSFAYNGIDRTTNNSAWLSFPDDIRKADLTTALDLSVRLTNSDNYETSIEDPTSVIALTNEEKATLAKLGYSNDILKYATKRNAYLNSVPTLELK